MVFTSISSFLTFLGQASPLFWAVLAGALLPLVLVVRSYFLTRKEVLFSGARAERAVGQPRRVGRPKGPSKKRMGKAPRRRKKEKTV